MKTEQIINEARSNSQLNFAGFGQYRVDTWSASHNAWWQGYSQDYYQALNSLRRSYIQSVIDTVGLHEEYKFDVDDVYNYSTWVKYARIIINYAKKYKFI